jgi:hypothetical protein
VTEALREMVAENGAYYLLAALALAGVPPGDYVLELAARLANGREAARRIAIAVVR